jgi:uncharacterized protein
VTPRLLALVLIALSAPGADFASLQHKGYVSDFAGVIKPESARRLAAYCARLERATGAQLAFVTVPALDGEPAADVANLLFRKWGIGQKGENNGALFLLSIQDRKSRLEVGYGLEPVIPDGAAGEMLRHMRPALRRGDYGAALETAAAELGERITRAKNVDLPAQDVRRERKRRGTAAPIAALAAVMIALMVAGIGARRNYARNRYMPGPRAGDMLAGMVIGSLLNSGHRSRGGGGFGGYDSGDSFGGFGGGDSGGGGASSDW